MHCLQILCIRKRNLISGRTEAARADLFPQRPRRPAENPFQPFDRISIPRISVQHTGSILRRNLIDALLHQPLFFFLRKLAPVASAACGSPGKQLQRLMKNNAEIHRFHTVKPALAKLQPVRRKVRECTRRKLLKPCHAVRHSLPIKSECRLRCKSPLLPM